jgi:hypothetical protein
MSSGPIVLYSLSLTKDYFIYITNIGCDWWTRDVYSSFAPEPTSGYPRACVYSTLNFIFFVGGYKIDHYSLFSILAHLS